MSRATGMCFFVLDAFATGCNLVHCSWTAMFVLASVVSSTLLAVAWLALQAIFRPLENWQESVRPLGVRPRELNAKESGIKGGLPRT